MNAMNGCVPSSYGLQVLVLLPSAVHLGVADSTVCSHAVVWIRWFATCPLQRLQAPVLKLLPAKSAMQLRLTNEAQL